MPAFDDLKGWNFSQQMNHLLQEIRKSLFSLPNFQMELGTEIHNLVIWCCWLQTCWYVQLPGAISNGFGVNTFVTTLFNYNLHRVCSMQLKTSYSEWFGGLLRLTDRVYILFSSKPRREINVFYSISIRAISGAILTSNLLINMWICTMLYRSSNHMEASVWVTVGPISRKWTAL